MGMIDEKWFQSAADLYPVLKKLNPTSQNHFLDRKKQIKLEFENGMFFTMGLLRHSFYDKALSFWFKTFILKPLSKFHYIFFREWFKKRCCI
jgi:hypothetical protein